MAETLCKGQNFKGILRDLVKLHPDVKMESVHTAVSADFSQALRYGGIVAAGWYPVQWYRELHGAIGRTLGTGPEFAYELGRSAAHDDFTGVYRFLASVLSPEILFAQSRRVMAMYFKGGTIEKADVHPGSGTVRFSNWAGFDAFIWHDILGAIVGLLELGGARNCSHRILAGGTDDALHVELHWSK